MARKELLKPSGPYAVGSITHELRDDKRPMSLVGAEHGRRLFVKAWYPAAPPADAGNPEGLWTELRSETRMPLMLRWLIRYLSKIRTSTFTGAPWSRRVRCAPLVIYNHGLISFASENTSLAEDLASHGFVVIAIRHTEQLSEWQGLEHGRSKAKRQQDAALSNRLKSAAPTEKAAIAREYYEESTNASRIVTTRAEDMKFVLEHIDRITKRIPGNRGFRLDNDRIHAIGFSLGGAVGTEFCKEHHGARAVVNLDGGLQGRRIDGPIDVPYLMMYSSANAGINDALLPRHATRVTRPDTMHLNYHDISMLLPVLRYAQAIGKTDAREFITFRNRTVREFLLAAQNE